MYPRLKVKLNRELDEKVCLEFLGLKRAGVDFGEGIIKTHPALQAVRNPVLNQNKKLSLIKRYVSWFYKGNSDGLEVIKTYSQERWDKSAKGFFEACDKYFENSVWPEGKYIAYLSIFNCNPRFLENKTFQVFWKHPKGFVSVAAHEMLHFLFYDVVKKVFPKRDESKDHVWILSEITNFFLLSEPEFVKITQDPNPSLYPQLTMMAENLKEEWERSRNVIKFLKATL